MESSEEFDKLEEETNNFPYRVDWYQTDKQVVLTIFRKKENTYEIYHTSFTETSLKFTTMNANGTIRVKKTFTLAKLIDPESALQSISPSKIEIKMTKLDYGIWPHYELQNPSSHMEQIQPAKSWDKIVRNVEEDKQEEGDEAVNTFFSEIYDKASDNMKKAMIKSFTESKGTELSTNWDQVSQAPVTIKPPEGMEWKPWDN